MGINLGYGATLTPGIAHGSVQIDGAFESKRSYPPFRDRDDNSRRHSGYFAIYDWCYGNDQQWLIDTLNDHRIYSHDHGLFLRPRDAFWNYRTLEEFVGTSNELYASPANLDRQELQRLADRIESVTQPELLAILAKVPVSWPVSDTELEALGWFLASRAGPAAARTRKLLG